MGPCLGSYGGAREGWRFLMSEVPLYKRVRVDLEFRSRNVQRYRGGLVFKAHRLRVTLNFRLESNNEEEEG